MQDANTRDDLLSSTRPAATPGVSPATDISERLAALLGVSPTTDFLSGSRLAAMLGVSTMTIYRWEHDERLNFPAPSRVHGRKFWYRPDVLAWMKARAVQQTPRTRSVTDPLQGAPRR